MFSKGCYIIWAMCLVHKSWGLQCYNCTSSHRTWAIHCAGDFSSPIFARFNNSRKHLVNCTGENAMCFVRSWRSRSEYRWLVQRGCYYLPAKLDTLLHSFNIPTRAMTCRNERLPDAEYKVCLCNADWCNTAPKISSASSYIITLLYLFLNYL